MAEDWDLLAVVRSCSAAAIATKVATTTTTTAGITNPIAANNSIATTVGDPLPGFAALTDLDPHESPFPFPGLLGPRCINPFEELQELCKPYFPAEGQSIVPQISTSSISSLHGGFREQQIQQIQQHVHLQQQQVQLQQQGLHQFHKARPSPAFSSRTNQPPIPRPKRRKNQQKKIVTELTAESLTADMWAWRKYGQKPIKGSAHPRNYYRCSSSKGCTARKQVERSPSDPNKFLVTYTGDHTHPRPTHRNSLAGSTRNKFSAIAKPNSSDPEAAIAKASCSNSPISASSLSPTTPLNSKEDEIRTLKKKTSKSKDTPNDDAEINIEETVEACSSGDVDDGGGDDDDSDNLGGEDLLIPNIVVSDDVFMGLEELGPESSTTSPAQAAAQARE